MLLQRVRGKVGWLLLSLLVLWGCQDQSDQAVAETQAASSTVSEWVAQRSNPSGEPGSINASGSILYPAADEALIHERATLRLQVEAELETGIDQLFIRVAAEGDQGAEPVEFQLCDSDCGGTESLAGWVSGLGLAELDSPADEMSLQISLLVQDTTGTYEIVDAIDLVWSPALIEVTSAELQASVFSARWEAPEGYRHFNVYAAEGHWTSWSQARSAPQVSRRLGLNDPEVELGGLPTDQPLTFWITGVGSGGEDIVSTLLVAPGLTVNDLVLNAAALGEPLVVTGTLDTDELADRVDAFSLSIEDPLEPGELLWEDRVGIENLQGSAEGSEFELDGSTGEWIYEYTGEWPMPFADELLTAAEAITVTLQAGSPLAGTASADLVVKTTPPNEDTVTIYIDPVGGDGYLNAADEGTEITISGAVSGEDGQPGDEVIVEVYTESYTTELDAGRGFEVSVPFAVLEADTEVSVTVQATDAVGNEGSVTASAGYVVDTTAPQVGVFDLQTNDPSPILSGTMDQDGTVEVSVDGESYAAELEAGSWSLDLDAEGVTLAPGVYAVEATGTDQAGNTGSASGELDINTEVPVLEVDDLQVNQASTLSLEVTGTWDPDADNVDTLSEFTLIIDDPDSTEFNLIEQTLTPNEPGLTQVLFDPDGTWTYTQGEWPGLFSDTLVTYQDLVEARLTNVYGTTAEAQSDAIVKTTPPNEDTVTIDIDPVGGDGYLNAADEGTEITISGAVSGEDGQPGDEVIVEVYTESYTTELDAGRVFEVSVPFAVLEADTEVSVTVQATDAVGNEGSVTASAGYVVDTTIPESPELTLVENTGTDPELTSNGTVLISELEADATWEYSIDAGDTWLEGTEDSFVLPEGLYDSGTVLARQADLAGNTSDPGLLLITIRVDASQPVANDRSYSLFPGNINSLVVPDDQGIMTNDEDPFDSGLVVNEPDSIEPQEGEGTLAVNADGGFEYEPGTEDTRLVFSYQAVAGNGELSAAATVTLDLRPATGIVPQICTDFPVVLEAGRDLIWELDPLQSVGTGAEFTLQGAPGGGLGLTVSDTTASFSNPTAGVYHDITLQASNDFGGESTLGPFSVEVVPGLSGEALVPWDGLFEPGRMIPRADGRLLVAGNLARAGQADQLLVASLHANGELDADFGNDGFVTVDLPDTTLTTIIDEAAANESLSVAVRDMVQDRGSLYVWGAVERDDGTDDWLSPFLLKLHAESGFPDMDFADSGLWTEETEDDGPINVEAGAFMVENAGEALLSLNELTADRRPADMALYRINPFVGPDTAQGPLIGNPSSAELGNRDTLLRPQKIIPGPEPGSFMLLSQALSSQVDSGELHVTWHDSSGGDLLTDYGVDVLGDNLGYQLLFASPVSRDPTVTEAVLTDTGRLFMTGQLVTQDGYDRRIYLVEMDLDYADGGDNDLLLQLTLGDLPAGDLVALGLQPSVEQGVELTYLHEDATEVYVERYPTANDRDESARRSGDLAGNPSPVPVAAPTLDGDFRYLHAHSSAAEALQLSLPARRSLTDYQVYSENCGVVSRAESEGDGPIPRLGDYTTSGEDLVLAMQGIPGWRLDRLTEGLQPVGLERGETYLREFPLEPVSVNVQSVATDSSDRVLLIGQHPNPDFERVLWRLQPEGEPDPTFNDGAGQVAIPGFSPSLVLDSQDRAHYAYTDSGQLEIRRRLPDGEPDASGAIETSKQFVRLLVDSQDRLYALLSGDALEVVRFNPDLTVDTGFGDNGSWLSATDRSLTGALIDTNDRVVLYTGSGNGLSPVRIFVLNQSGTPDAAFADDGVLELETAEPALYYTQGHRYPIVEKDAHFYFVLFEDAMGAVVGRIDQQGVLDTQWGNFGYAPTGEPLNTQSSDISGLVHYSGQIGIMWEGFPATGLTWLDEVGNPVTTSWFGALDGDRAEAIQTTVNGRLLLLNALENEESETSQGIVWGINADGGNIDGFGNQDPGNGDLGTVQNGPTFSPSGLLTSPYGTISLAGTDVAGAPEWQVLTYELRDLLAGELDPVETLLDLVDSILDLSTDESWMNDVSQQAGGRGLLGGYSETQGEPNPQNHLLFVDRFGVPGEGFTLDPMSYPNAEPFELFATDRDQQDRTYVLLHQPEPSDRWAIGRFSEVSVGELELDTDSYGDLAGWNLEGSAIPKALAVTPAGQALVGYRPESEPPTVVRLDGSGLTDTGWGDGGSPALTGPSLTRLYALHADGVGAVYLGGAIDQQPAVIRLDAAGSETHRWVGDMLTRSAVATVVDFAPDPRGHLHVQMDAYHDGVWQSRVMRLPAILTPTGPLN